MSSNLLESLIGALVLLVAGWFLIFAYDRSSAAVGDGGYELIARFDKVDGLAVGSDVRLGGIKVGAIRTLSIDENYYAVVRMNIKSDLQMPTDSSAAITSAGLLGGNYISLSPGGDIEYMQAGDEFQETQGAVDLVTLIGKFVNGGGND